MTSKEALEELIENAHEICEWELFRLKIIKQDLEVLEQLEILKKYYSPFKKFLEEMFEKGYNEDLTKVKEWLENDPNRRD